MINVYMQRMKQESQQQVEQTVIAIQKSQVMVFVARKDISAGAYVAPDMIDTATIFKKQLPPNAVRHFGELENKSVTRAIKRGEILTTDSLRGGQGREGTDEETAETTLSMAIPKGKRAITIPVDNISSLVGMVKPGDYVDVLGILSLPLPGSQAAQSMTVTLFQNVLVLAVGNEFKLTEEAKAANSGLLSKFFPPKKDESKKEEKAPLITLALQPEEAGIISYVQENGKLKLVLRSPYDQGTKEIPPINMQIFYQFLASKGAMIPVPRPVDSDQQQPTMMNPLQGEESEGKGIEVYRGQEMEVMKPGVKKQKK